jgi:16S rRNA (cytosine1402-N4)-methyltransferase
MNYHEPVLLKESIDGLQISNDGIYVDVTFGGGGHSKEILRRLGDNGKLIAFDQDKDSLNNSINDKRFQLINQNFMYLSKYLNIIGIQKVDGILADFGISSHQIDKPERGFSIRFDGDLDMRMNQDSELTAKYIINNYSFENLRKVFFEFGELRLSSLISRKIVESRLLKEISTTSEFNKLLNSFLPKKRINKILSQVYQALRIEVNQELDVIKSFLKQTENVLKSNGRLSVISYHSLEDRLVKRYIRNGLFKGDPEKDVFGNVKVPFSKVGKLITPTNSEISNNNRARSAKLRIAKKN